MVIPEGIRVFKLLHNMTILPKVVSRCLLRPVLWARLIQQIIQTACVRIGGPIMICRFTSTPLRPVLCISVGHKIHATLRLAFASVSMTRRFVLLLFRVAILPSLPCFIIIRFGILGTVRIGILY